MVDVKKAGFVAQNFEESVTINAESVPSGNLSIESVGEVVIKSGFAAGQNKLVLKLRGENEVLYSYFPNKTAVGAIAKMYGEDTDRWTNKIIVLSTEGVMVQGKKQKMIVIVENK